MNLLQLSCDTELVVITDHAACLAAHFRPGFRANKKISVSPKPTCICARVEPLIKINRGSFFEADLHTRVRAQNNLSPDRGISRSSGHRHLWLHSAAALVLSQSLRQVLRHTVLRNHGTRGSRRLFDILGCARCDIVEDQLLRPPRHTVMYCIILPLVWNISSFSGCGIV